MMTVIYRSQRVDVGSSAYNAERTKAESIAATQRSVGKPATCVWHDEYNDYSARGHFVVTSRS